MSWKGIRLGYGETFSPVAKFISIPVVLTLTALKINRITQFDTKTGFFNGDLSKEVYVQQPVGFDDQSRSVRRLRKNLYGLQQASRC